MGILIQHLDMQIEAWAAGLITPWLTEVMKAASFLGSHHVFFAAAGLLITALVIKKRWQDVWMLLLAYAGGEVTVSLLKSMIPRARPAAPLIPVHGSASFPSGSAFSIALLCGFLTYLIWPVLTSVRTRALTLIFFSALIVAVGFSRVYLRVHWLTDVLTGVIVAFVWLLLAKWLTVTICRFLRY
jgi:membrane-associated phospholipid phosphatase